MIKLIFIFVTSLLFHPVHVSLGSLDYDDEKASFSLFLKLFSDDLENDCRLMKKDAALQLYDENYMPSREIIEEYLDSRLFIESDNKRLKGVLGEIAADAEEVRINVTYEYAGKGRSFRIVNKIMTDLFDDQANLLIFRIDNYEEGFKFTPQLTEVIINAAVESY
ncbi:MAG: DUF6702 family protein [Bacteroidales bacterium]